MAKIRISPKGQEPKPTNDKPPSKTFRLGRGSEECATLRIGDTEILFPVWMFIEAARNLQVDSDWDGLNLRFNVRIRGDDGNQLAAALTFIHETYLSPKPPPQKEPPPTFQTFASESFTIKWDEVDWPIPMLKKEMDLSGIVDPYMRRKRRREHW